MPYASGRVIHDADAHIMETPNWLRDHADPSIRDRIQPLHYPGGNELRQSQELHERNGGLDAAFDRLTASFFPRYCNVRKATIYAGSNEIQRNIIAKATLGL